MGCRENASIHRVIVDFLGIAGHGHPVARQRRFLDEHGQSPESQEWPAWSLVPVIISLSFRGLAFPGCFGHLLRSRGTFQQVLLLPETVLLLEGPARADIAAACGTKLQPPVLSQRPPSPRIPGWVDGWISPGLAQTSLISIRNMVARALCADRRRGRTSRLLCRTRLVVGCVY